MLKMPRTNQSPCLGTIAAAALVGGLIGAVVGLMVAPKSGKAMRQDFHANTDRVLERVGNVTLHHTEAIKHQGTELAEKGKQLANDLHTFIQESLNSNRNLLQVTQSEELVQPSVEDDITMPEPPIEDQ